MEEEKEIRHWIVYMYTFPNNKRYIGKTCRKLSERQGENFKGYKRCTLLWKAINKYGVENIKQDILFEGDINSERSGEIERFYISFLKTNCNRYKNPSFGYNLTDGGEGVAGWKPSPERLEVLQNQMKEIHENRKGTHLSEEWRKKLSEAHIGKSHPCSEEVKKKISFKNSRENLTEENRKNRSNSKKKKVAMISNETNKISVFGSHTDMATYFQVPPSSISKWLKTGRCTKGNYTIQEYMPTETERGMRDVAYVTVRPGATPL